ncbi:hypothetical protein AK812_SmicGene15157 [Symbiodinium microadriaticum]|uniref:EF-hand domain-containing protein n=1 Tax=Symbiodinium microadriaticum TaxID=2951 RepID=A0A1Q9E3P2_SYMMI|nr:hypothetical protein AK812_SmicGene15157 [Symbiodinium microadriaticum]
MTSNLVPPIVQAGPTLQPEVSEAADPVPEHPDTKETVPPVETTVSSRDLLLNVGRKKSEGSQMSVASAHASARVACCFNCGRRFDMFAADNADNDEIAPAPGPVSSEGRVSQRPGIGIKESRSGWHRFQNRIKSFIDYGAAVRPGRSVQLEFEGSAIGGTLGLIEGPDMEQVEPVFRLLDRFFVFVFTAELLMRLAVVVLGLVDFYFSLQVESGDVVPKDIVLLRLVRALKSLRAFRMMRSFRLFRGLFMTMGALIMGHLGLDDDARFSSCHMEVGIMSEVIWLKYGTAYRAMYTLYEITFAGLEIIFRAIDDSGDGIITEARMNEIAAYFQTLDLDVHEGAALFHLLDNGDGEASDMDSEHC